MFSLGWKMNDKELDSDVSFLPSFPSHLINSDDAPIGKVSSCSLISSISVRLETIAVSYKKGQLFDEAPPLSHFLQMPFKT